MGARRQLQPRRPSLEERVTRLEAGWVEAHRITGRLTKEIMLLQSHVKECDSSLATLVLLVGGLDEVFSTVSNSVTSST